METKKQLLKTAQEISTVYDRTTVIGTPMGPLACGGVHYATLYTTVTRDQNGNKISAVIKAVTAGSSTVYANLRFANSTPKAAEYAEKIWTKFLRSHRYVFEPQCDEFVTNDYIVVSHPTFSENGQYINQKLLSIEPSRESAERVWSYSHQPQDSVPKEEPQTEEAHECNQQPNPEKTAQEDA